MAVPQFTVDLDVEPEERWKEVILYYKDRGVLDALTRWSPDAPHPSHEQETAWLEVIKSLVDEEYMREIDGWIKYGEANVTRDGMLLATAMYEQNSPVFCSGLVAAMPNGTVVHGRNMDYDGAFEVNGKVIGWPELTVDVTFLRGGKPLMTSVTWPGQLGIHTAMRFDGWTFEQNTRQSNNLQLNLAAARKGGQIFTLHVRRVMERVPDFETAVQELWSANLAAPMYFILTGKGPYEAAVLTMDRGGVHESSSPPLTRLSEENRSWHLLQTNDDANALPLDFRRPAEKFRLGGSAQSQVNPEWILAEMHGLVLKQPTTVFTWIAVPATGFHQTILPSEKSMQPAAVNEIPSRALGKTFLSPRRALM